jgi:hypothetical protein
VRFYRQLVGVMLLFPLSAVKLKGQAVSCSSSGTDDERHYCQADTRHGAHLVKQASSVECVEGRTWGWDEAGVWVDKGCAGEFALGKAETESGLEHPPSKDKNASKAELRITCESTDGRRNDCDADLKWSTVRLARQMGPSPCTEGSTWGHDDKEVWVDRGCRGEFVVQRTSPGDQNCESSIGKKEAKKLLERCVQVSPGTHPPCNVANSCVGIKEEIRRSCQLRGKDAPKYCEEYQ